jgi:carbon monoxide dehydrogenase subunit G
VRSETEKVFVARPPAVVFDWVADHRNVSRVLDGVQRWEPSGEPGVGTRYQVRIGALGLGLGTTLKLTRWQPPKEIAWASERSPLPVAGRWRFTPARAGTEVELTVDYEPPYGLLGRFLGQRLEGLLRNRIRRALRRMKEAIESR